MNTDKNEKSYKDLMLRKSWSFLHDNFHKFNQANKIKVALTLCTKDIPTEINGNIKLTSEKKAKLVADIRKLR